jgi:hypothetical protein
MPKLPEFSGKAEDWIEWQEDVKSELSVAGFDHYIDAESTAIRDSTLEQRVFACITGAIRKGQASAIAEQFTKAKNKDPVAIWKTLEETYDTALSRASAVVCELKKMIQLRLDESTTADDFCNVFRTSMTRAITCTPRLAEVDEVFRAILLGCIHDPTYDTIREDIVKYEDRQTREHLDALIQKQRLGEKKDEAAGSVTVRKTKGVRFDPKSQEKKHCYIPWFPKGWNKVYPPHLFEILKQWREAVNTNQLTSYELNSKFQLEYRPPVRPATPPPSTFSQQKTHKKKGSSRGNANKKARKTTTEEDAANPAPAPPASVGQILLGSQRTVVQE